MEDDEIIDKIISTYTLVTTLNANMGAIPWGSPPDKITITLCLRTIRNHIKRKLV